MLQKQTARVEQPLLAPIGDVPLTEIGDSRYTVCFARTAAEVDAVLALRFEVFNLELGEGLVSSYETGRDEDEFDSVCRHLMVVERASGRVVGTYRLQTCEMAAAGRGFYSTTEFDLSRLPADVLDDAVEVGRACVAADHRNTRVLFLLWKGLAAYVAHNRKRYLFGCCSLTSQDPAEGESLRRSLYDEGHIHPRFDVAPLPDLECVADLGDAALPAVQMPKLFAIYLRYGAKVCGRPALDRAFGTVDFFVLFDVAALDPFSRRAFFGD